MANTSAMCTSFKQEILVATHNFTASTGNTFKIALYDSSATLGASTTAYSSSEEITIADLASKIGNLKSIPIEIEGIREKDSFYVPNIDMTMSDLGIKRFVNLDSAIQKTIEWYESK